MILYTLFYECGHAETGGPGPLNPDLIPAYGAEQPKSTCKDCGVSMRVSGVVITNDLYDLTAKARRLAADRAYRDAQAPPEDTDSVVTAPLPGDRITIVRVNGDFTDPPATVAPASSGTIVVTVKFPADWEPGLISRVILPGDGVVASVGLAAVYVGPGDTLTIPVGAEHIIVSPW